MALGNREVGIELRARDMASQALSSVGSGLDAVADKAQSTGGRFGALGKVVGTVGQGMQLAFGFSVAQKIAQGLSGIKSHAIDFNAKLEQWDIAFKQTLGSAEKASAFIAAMKEFAAKTPFEMPGLVDAAQKLTGAGMAAKDVIPTLTALGDAIAGAGKGQEYVVSATNSLTKMMRAGRATGESMMYLSESGVNAWQYLADGLGVSIPEAQKLVTKGQVDANKALQYIRDGVANSDLGGMMDVQSRTFNGAMSTINDQLRNVVAEGFAPFFKVISAGALSVANFLGSATFVGWGTSVAAAMTKVIGVTSGFLKTFTDVFKAVREGADPVRTLTGLIDKVRTQGFLALRDAVATVGDKFLMFISQFDALQPAIAPLILAFDTVRDALYKLGFFGTAALEDIDPLLQRVTDSLGRAASVFREVAFDRLAGNLGDLALKVRRVVDNFAPLAPIIQPVADALQGFSDAAAGIASGDFGAALDGITGAFSGLTSIIPGVFTAFDQFLTDMTPKIEEFAAQAVTWLGTALPSVLEGLTPLVQGMIEKVAVAGPKIAEMVMGWAMKLVDWIAPMIPPVLEALADWAGSMFTWVLQQAPVWAEKLMALGSQLITFITDRIPDALVAISAWAQSLFDWIINEGVPQAAAAIGPLAMKFVDWVFEMLPKLLDALDDIIGAIVDFIVTNAPVLVGKLIEWAQAFVGFIATEVIPRLIENLPTILRTIILFLGGAAGKIVGKAGQIGSGLVNHLLSFVKTLPGKVGGFIGQLPGKIGSFVGSIVGKAGELGGKLVGGIVDLVKALPGKVGGFILDVISTIGNYVGRMFATGAKIGTNFVKGIIDNLVSLPGKIWAMLTRLVREVFMRGLEIGPLKINASGIFLMGNQVASFAVGAWKVPQDMPAIVHEGEMIIPAALAGAIRSMARGSGTPANVPFPSGGAAGLATATSSVSNSQSITIVNHFGRDSIRGDDDIARISKEMAVQARMQGLSPTLRAIGTNT